MTTLFVVAGYFGLSVGAICTAMVIGFIGYIWYWDYRDHLMPVVVRAGGFKSSGTIHLWVAEIVLSDRCSLIVVDRGKYTFNCEESARETAYWAAKSLACDPERGESHWPGETAQ